MMTVEEFFKENHGNMAIPILKNREFEYQEVVELMKQYAEAKATHERVAGVVNRRELLLDFADYSESDKTSQTTDECVGNYLDSIK